MNIVYMVLLAVLFILVIIAFVCLVVCKEDMDEIKAIRQDIIRYEKRVDAHTNQLLDIVRNMSKDHDVLMELSSQVLNGKKIYPQNSSNGRFTSHYTEEEKNRAIEYMREHEDKSYSELAKSLGLPKTTIIRWANAQK